MTSSARVLFEAFLSDRDSPNPLGERPPTPGRWVEDLASVDPVDLAQSILIVEPWNHVGERPSDQSGVIASENIAYIADQILGVRTLIVPAWRSGVGDPERFAELASRAMLVAFEGGEPDVHIASSFSDAYTRSAATKTLVELMLRRVPFIGICLSHQLAAQAHVELVIDAVDRLESSEHSAFVEVSRRIAEVGGNLQVKKGYGTIAKSWLDDAFAVAKNEEVSHSNTRLYPYINIELDHVPTMVSEAHRVVAQKYEAIIDTALQYENELRIQAFHGNEVSEESVRFVCWAYQEIQHVITAYSLDAASIPQIQALMGAPIGVEILASTHTQSGDPLCEVAATGIYWEGGQTAVTTQFHPELDESLLTTSEGWAPAWEDMKRSDGIRLLARMLCACLR